MKKYELTEEEILELLDKAYELGWGGYKDLKEPTINTLFEEFAQDHPPLKEISMPTIVNDGVVWNGGVSGYPGAVSGWPANSYPVGMSGWNGTYASYTPYTISYAFGTTTA